LKGGPVTSTNAVRLGVSLSPQSASWPDIRRAAELVDRLGYDYLWTWDHLLAPFGREEQPIFESQMLLAALSQVTSKVRLGALVTANTLRPPALLAKMIVTLDHVSDGRAVLGMGAGWFEREHLANGIEFGAGFGERLDWLDEAVGVVRGLLVGETVRTNGRRYRIDGAHHLPGPIRAPIPLLVAGQGERRTLPIVARYADIWNAKGTPEELARKGAILDGLCRDSGRDPAAIERAISGHMVVRDDPQQALRAWAETLAANGAEPGSEPDPWFGTPEDVADRLFPYARAGFTTFSISMPAPFDIETIERFIGEVRPAILRRSAEAS
jgi:alkanesulfonate monooxygenase SsuD/methylene tetrahydromethanopterin reductase-like flavin-dependent oxidoreductase (luciferase family)